MPKNADSAAILRAYRNKLRDAKGNDAATERIEAAHTSLLMRGLNSRLTVRLAAAALPSTAWCCVLTVCRRQCCPCTCS